MTSICNILMMILANAEAALTTLLNVMAVPAVLLICFGGYFLWKGFKLKNENSNRLGKMLLMFGIVLLVIVLILTWFIDQYQTMSSAKNAV